MYDEGVALPVAPGVNFIGESVTAEVNAESGMIDVRITAAPGTGGGSGGGGWNPRGRYLPSDTYHTNDLVQFEGGLYLATQDIEPFLVPTAWSGDNLGYHNGIIPDQRLIEGVQGPFVVPPYNPDANPPWRTDVYTIDVETAGVLRIEFQDTYEGTWSPRFIVYTGGADEYTFGTAAAFSGRPLWDKPGLVWDPGKYYLEVDQLWSTTDFPGAEYSLNLVPDDTLVLRHPPDPELPNPWFLVATLTDGAGGATGAPGTPGQGFTYREQWSSTETYQYYDVVLRNGALWLAQGATEGSAGAPGEVDTSGTPINGTWTLFLPSGQPGAPGDPGSGGTSTSLAGHYIQREDDAVMPQRARLKFLHAYVEDDAGADRTVVAVPEVSAQEIETQIGKDEPFRDLELNPEFSAYPADANDPSFTPAVAMDREGVVRLRGHVRVVTPGDHVVAVLPILFWPRREQRVVYARENATAGILRVDQVGAMHVAALDDVSFWLDNIRFLSQAGEETRPLPPPEPPDPEETDNLRWFGNRISGTFAGCYRVLGTGTPLDTVSIPGIVFDWPNIPTGPPPGPPQGGAFEGWHARFTSRGTYEVLTGPSLGQKGTVFAENVEVLFPSGQEGQSQFQYTLNPSVPAPITSRVRVCVTGDYNVVPIWTIF